VRTSYAILNDQFFPTSLTKPTTTTNTTTKTATPVVFQTAMQMAFEAFKNKDYKSI